MSKAQFKKLLCKQNEIEVFNFIDDSINYLQSLKCNTMKHINNEIQTISILKSTRKTGFVGLIITSKSIKNIFIDTLITNDLDFLLTYKLSQDHLEMFFPEYFNTKYCINNNMIVK